MDVRSYLNEIKLELAVNAIVKNVTILQERVVLNQGFFRARLTLHNDDFLEVAEFFSVEQEQVLTVEYRFQWMDPSRLILRKRWDNAPHHPELPGFPHHVHMGDEVKVTIGRMLNIREVLDLITMEISEAGHR